MGVNLHAASIRSAAMVHAMGLCWRLIARGRVLDAVSLVGGGGSARIDGLVVGGGWPGGGFVADCCG